MKSSEFLERLTAELDLHPLVLAFVLVGSQARTETYTAKSQSDTEAYIVTSENHLAEMKSQLPNIVQKIDQPLFSYQNRWAGFSAVFADLTHIELPIVAVENLENVFSRPIQQPTKILIDKTGGKLELALAQRPTTLDYQKVFTETVTDFWYMAVVAAQYLHNDEIWNARHVQQVILVPALIKMMELLNDPTILLLETNKRIEQFLNYEQLEVIRALTPVYEQKAIQRALEQTLKEFSVVTKNIVQKHSYVFAEEIEKNTLPQLLELIGGS